MLSLYAFATDGVPLVDCENALLAEETKLRDGTVSAAELDQAKHEIVARLLGDRADVTGRRQTLGSALIMTGDTTARQIQKVTADDVQRDRLGLVQ
jgi:zinc protease